MTLMATPPPDILLELADVDFGYGEQRVLSNLNMQFRRHQVVAVMGGSGCGKTTVLRLIGGLVRAQRGQVRFEGVDIGALAISGLYAVRRKMGMLFQLGALFTDLSIFDNVAFALREHTELPEALIHDLALMKLNAVGLRGARYLMPSEISGGMARRVAFARAIALDPELILFDEPFAGLDPISLGIIANLIRSLNDALGPHRFWSAMMCGNRLQSPIMCIFSPTAASTPKARQTSSALQPMPLCASFSTLRPMAPLLFITQPRRSKPILV